MQENKLIDLSMDFAITIVNLCSALKQSRTETVLVNQLLRSGTSIGANIREANYAHSKADFIAKLQISLKECYESEYWVELLYRTNCLPDELNINLTRDLGVIRKILILSVNTAKNNQTSHT